MKGIALVGMLVTLLIVLYLTISNLKSKPAPGIELERNDSTPATLFELPTEIKGKLNEAVERNEAQRKEAEEILGN